MVVNEIEVVYCSWQSTVSYCFSFYDARENVMGVVWRKMRVHVLMVWFLVDLAPVVQKMDSAIHRINLYPVDSAIGFSNLYPLDSDLSNG